MALDDPIRSITPADEDGNAIGNPVTDIPCPSIYQWGKDDLSSDEAGRTLDWVMHKMRQARGRYIQLGWKGLSLVDASTVLKAFNSEYSIIECLDAEEGDWVTRLFYTGGTKAALYSMATNPPYWESVSFQISQSIPDPG